jgi:hypothetical protein
MHARASQRQHSSELDYIRQCDSFRRLRPDRFGIIMVMLWIG